MSAPPVSDDPPVSGSTVPQPTIPQGTSAPLHVPPPSTNTMFTPQPNPPPSSPMNGNRGRTTGGTTRRDTGGGALQDETVQDLMIRLDRHVQQFLDKVAPYAMHRWVSLVVLLLLFLLRIVLLQGFYIVVYVLFIFILNQFILFLQPKDRASLIAKLRASANRSNEDNNNNNNNNNNSNNNNNNNNNNINNNQTEIEEESTAKLPTLDDEEFRPFVRRLPEFKFWYSTTYATCLAIFSTFFKAFDVPVFWPLLLFYFIMLFVATMRRQWLDMKTLKYVPWDIGSKKVYKSDPKKISVSVKNSNLSSQQQQQQVLTSSRAPPPVPTIQISPKKPTAMQSANATTL